MSIPPASIELRFDGFGSAHSDGANEATNPFLRQESPFSFSASSSLHLGPNEIPNSSVDRESTFRFGSSGSSSLVGRKTGGINERATSSDRQDFTFRFGPLGSQGSSYSSRGLNDTDKTSSFFGQQESTCRFDSLSSSTHGTEETSGANKATKPYVRQDFTFRFDASDTSSSGGSGSNGLCDDCAKLDLEKSFASAFNLYEGARRGTNNRTLEVYRSDEGPPYLGHFYFVASLGNRLSRVTHCKLCNFLRQTISDPSRGTYKLLAICSSESYLFQPREIDHRGRSGRQPWASLDHNVFLAVVPVVPLIPNIGVPLRWFESELPKTGAIYRLTRPAENLIALPVRLGPWVDFNRIGRWLKSCRHTHKCCAPRKPPPASLEGFRVINCAKDPLVVETQPWSERYVALSYVWGSNTSSEDWQQTILDAVEVTKCLGERYLWVDRLCIDQTNSREKQSLISKMDEIYQGAEFTIIVTAGDASTGLPGMATAARTAQPCLELCSPTSDNEAAESISTPKEDWMLQLFGITMKEAEETADHAKWLDEYRFGLRSKMTIGVSRSMEYQEILNKYDISEEQLEIFHDMAEMFETPLDEWMMKMKQWAERAKVPLNELAPHIIKDMATKSGTTEDVIARSLREGRTDPPRKQDRLPAGLVVDKTILVSTLEDPRVTVSSSKWATRGWTYQEGVLSSRRLVFTDKQVYWECRSMTMNESLDIPVLGHSNSIGAGRLTDHMLSGIFDGQPHRVPELAYGFETHSRALSERVQKLDDHIRNFTSRTLTYEEDSLNAFLGIAAHFSTENGLHVLLGMPVWTGRFGNRKPGLRDTFALSISTWTHAAQQVTRGAKMYVADCTRRPQFPSWSWAGWEGRADFSVSAASDNNLHVDFFTAMTSKDWCSGIDANLWSAKMELSALDGSVATLLSASMPFPELADPGKTCLLRIHEPLVLKGMHLMQSVFKGEWRRLYGKTVQIHLSVHMTEAELMTGHQNGELLTVLVFASTTPFIYSGTARYLILRKVNNTETHWTRIGRMVMTIRESEMEKFKTATETIAGLPVKRFGRAIELN